jgi:diacylglycerol kinase (ATP)
MAASGARGLERLVRAFGFTLAGLRAAWRNEEAFRQEVVLTVVLVPVALWLGQTVLERAALLVSMLVVLVVELLNSALETVVDRIGSERHELSGRAKDIGSAAVFLSLVLAALVWTAVAWHRWG